jgi:MSHA biogenesis protein MshI
MAFFSSKKRAQGWMAVTVLPDRIDIAHVCRRPDGRPEVRTLDSYRKERRDADSLAILRKQYHLGGYRCITALNSGDYQILQLDAPDVPREELKEAVRWGIKDMIDFPPDAATIDLVEVPSEQAGTSRARNVHVFCARNDVIRARMQLFETAGIPLEAIDVPEMALRNVAMLWARPERAVAMIDIDESGGMLVIVADGELHASRRLDVTAGQLAGTDEGEMHSQLEWIGLEMQRSFDHYGRQFGAVPLTRVLVAAAMAPRLVEQLSTMLEVPVEAADLASVMDFPSVPELRESARQAQCLPTLGLALRDEGGEG